MKNSISAAILLLFGNLIIGQTNLKTSEGAITFNASTPLEDIYAVNNEVNAILQLENGQFAAVLLMKDFRFKRALMQEHFNENYVESERYPKAYFTGRIIDFNIEEVPYSEKEFTIEGKLTIHGLTRSLTTKNTLKKHTDGIEMKSVFMIKPEEFNIKVPKLLFKKIAQEVLVEVHFLLNTQ
ncbi:YceI family protein [Muriicola sp. Z0-33]|uniref:YceI family protein n=1 Tax=Muriicola sp. Z0-33 TaxID=2816957 RepID=UPI002238AF58|nr:YceI family protein [Muriicola sp. Z0-33]MCW5517068.1 YceI family protein [Muriicola sp. Z0-33]